MIPQKFSYRPVLHGSVSKKEYLSFSNIQSVNTEHLRIEIPIAFEALPSKFVNTSSKSQKIWGLWAVGRLNPFMNSLYSWSMRRKYTASSFSIYSGMLESNVRIYLSNECYAEHFVRLQNLGSACCNQVCRYFSWVRANFSSKMGKVGWKSLSCFGRGRTAPLSCMLMMLFFRYNIIRVSSMLIIRTVHSTTGWVFFSGVFFKTTCTKIATRWIWGGPNKTVCWHEGILMWNLTKIGTGKLRWLLS